MNIDIHARDGSSKGSIELNPEIFGIEPNTAVMHQAVKMHLANRRQGTHKTKERAEVRGGGRKPWRQKGRGVARAGTIRSPLWSGGGTIFGPRPHSYRQAMPKKMRRLARRSALSLKARANELTVVDALNFREIKTAAFASMLSVFGAPKKVLVLTAERNLNAMMSGRNISGCTVMTAAEASTYDLLNNRLIIIEQGALEILESLLLEEKGSVRAEAEGENNAEVETEEQS
jgi:large subunit ribosomal protein L4